MRSVLIGLIFALALLPGLAAQAQTFPTRSVKLVAGFPPGTTVDIVARLIAQKLGELWGKPVVVENLPGAGGNLAAGSVSRAAPDGYTLLLAPPAIAISATLYSKLSYKLATDLTGVTEVASQSEVMVIAKNLGPHTLKDFIAVVKAKPHQFNFAHSGIGSFDYLADELFTHVAGLDMVQVPYQGSTAAMTDLISGSVSMDQTGISSGLPFIKNQQVVAIGLSGSQRSPALPDVPTIAEGGLPGYDVTLWSGLLAPAATPPAVLDKIAADIAGVLKQPDMRQRFAALGMDAKTNSPAEFQAFLKTETDKWGGVVKSLGLKVD